MDALDIVPLDLAAADTAEALLTVQRAAYEVEAALIGYPDLPMLAETLAELRDSGESFLGAYADGRLVGAVSWKRLVDGTVDIYRLVVDPAVHRRGVATALLDVLAAAEPADRVVVATGSDNAPALALYARHGFVPVGERTVGPGVRLTDLERRAIP